MSFRNIALLAVAALAFGVLFLGILVSQRSKPNVPATKPAAALQPLEGKLAIQSVDDLRVGGRKILLCGAAFTKPQAMRAMVTEAARRDYQGLVLSCKPVGAGTPCDGNIASTFGEARVVQCFTPDGMDLAAQLIRAGILCGQPSQAGATYAPC